jgi:hypothetical protein
MEQAKNTVDILPPFVVHMHSAPGDHTQAAYPSQMVPTCETGRNQEEDVSAGNRANLLTLAKHLLRIRLHKRPEAIMGSCRQFCSNDWIEEIFIHGAMALKREVRDNLAELSDGFAEAITFFIPSFLHPFLKLRNMECRSEVTENVVTLLLEELQSIY